MLTRDIGEDGWSAFESILTAVVDTGYLGLHVTYTPLVDD